MLLFELHNRNAKIVGKLSEIKVCDVTVGELEVHPSLILSETVLGLVSVQYIKFSKTRKLKKRMVKKNEKEIILNDKHSRICTDHFTKDSLKQNLSARSSLGSAFKPRRLDLKKVAMPTIFNFKIGIGQKRSHGNNHSCPPKSGATLQESVRLAFAKRRKLKIRICHLVIN